MTDVMTPEDQIHVEMVDHQQAAPEQFRGMACDLGADVPEVAV